MNMKREIRFISVIVPIYHGKRYIANMIRQVEKCKSYLKKDDVVELIFVNDDPDDFILIESNTRLIEIIILNTNENVGIQRSRLKGLKKSKGEYILFLDQDDKIRPQYLSSQILALGKNDAVVCQAIHDGKVFYRNNNIFEKVVTKDMIVGEWNSIISPGQVLLRKQSIPEIWKENILKNNGADDWFLWLCMISKGCFFSLNSDILYEHVLNNDNFSMSKSRMLLSEQEVIRIIYEKNIFNHNIFLSLLNGFFKRNRIQACEYEILEYKYKIMSQWMWLTKNDIKISKYLIAKKIKKIAIYGCGELGKYLYAELKKDKQIYVDYFIDRNANKIEYERPVYLLECTLPEVDCIIVTLINNAEIVKRQLKKIFDNEIIVLSDWITLECKMERNVDSDE